MPPEFMRDVVFAYRKNFADIYHSHGEVTVANYAREIYRVGKSSDAHIAAAIKSVTEKILGEEVREVIVQSLSKHNYVSTVDHHGPLSHPAFFQPNLLRMALDQEHDLPATIVLSCASVSLDNHTFPRGLYFYDAYGERVRIPFFSLHDRHRTVYGHLPFTKSEALKRIEKVRSYSEIYDVLETILLDDALYRYDTYRAQVTYLNYQIMRKLCPEGGSFVSIAIEDVVRDLLCSSFLEHDTLTASILFNNEVRTCFLRETNGIQTSHDFTRKDTTTFFWGQRAGARIPLRVREEYLCDEQGIFRIHLDSESLKEALQEEMIFPNLALSLIILSSRGMNLGGGFFQVDYLPSLILHTQNVARVCGIHGIPWGRSEYLGGDFTFLPPFDDEAITPLSILKNPPCLTDITYYGETMRVKDAIDRIVPDMYHILNNKLRNEWEHVVKDTAESR